MSVEAISWALNVAPVPADRSGQPSSACKFVLVGVGGRYNGVVYAMSTRNGRLLARIPVGAGLHGVCVFPQLGRYSLGQATSADNPVEACTTFSATWLRTPRLVLPSGTPTKRSGVSCGAAMPASDCR